MTRVRQESVGRKGSPGHLGLSAVPAPLAPWRPWRRQATPAPLGRRTARDDRTAGPPGVDGAPGTVPDVDKGYVDAADALRLPLAGGTMTGELVMGGYRLLVADTPTIPTEATSKNYVDVQDGKALLKSGGGMSGPIYLGQGRVPSVDDEATPKSYVDSQDQAAFSNLLERIVGLDNRIAALEAALSSVRVQELATDRTIIQDGLDTIVATINIPIGHASVSAKCAVELIGSIIDRSDRDALDRVASDPPPCRVHGRRRPRFTRPSRCSRSRLARCCST